MQALEEMMVRAYEVLEFVSGPNVAGFGGLESNVASTQTGLVVTLSNV